jgi:hypothetical protein
MATTDPTTDELLKTELLKLDILLRRKQSFWETPRAILLIVATCAAVFGLLGWKIGSAPPQPIVVQFGGPPLQVHISPETKP